MKKYFFSLLVLLMTWNVQAHNPDVSSTVLVEKEDNKWILQIRSALTGFDYAIKAKYPNETEPYKTPEEFQAMVLEHLKEHIQIQFNGEAMASLQNGGIKLGHETVAVFEVIGVPTSIQAIQVKNSSFQSVSRNQSALVILKKGFKKKQFILNNKNQHTMNLKVADAQFLPADKITLPAEINNDYSYVGIALTFLGLFLVAFGYRKFFG